MAVESAPAEFFDPDIGNANSVDDLDMFLLDGLPELGIPYFHLIDPSTIAKLDMFLHVVAVDSEQLRETDISEHIDFYTSDFYHYRSPGALLERIFFDALVFEFLFTTGIYTLKEGKSAEQADAYLRPQSPRLQENWPFAYDPLVFYDWPPYITDDVIALIVDHASQKIYYPHLRHLISDPVVQAASATAVARVVEEQMPSMGPLASDQLRMDSVELAQAQELRRRRIVALRALIRSLKFDVAFCRMWNEKSPTTSEQIFVQQFQTAFAIDAVTQRQPPVQFPLEETGISKKIDVIQFVATMEHQDPSEGRYCGHIYFHTGRRTFSAFRPSLLVLLGVERTTEAHDPTSQITSLLEYARHLRMDGIVFTKSGTFNDKFAVTDRRVCSRCVTPGRIVIYHEAWIIHPHQQRARERVGHVIPIRRMQRP